MSHNKEEKKSLEEILEKLTENIVSIFMFLLIISFFIAAGINIFKMMFL
jgi:uncharacterized membrane protein (DUF373 family)